MDQCPCTQKGSNKGVWDGEEEGKEEVFIGRERRWRRWVGVAGTWNYHLLVKSEPDRVLMPIYDIFLSFFYLSHPVRIYIRTGFFFIEYVDNIDDYENLLHFFFGFLN